LRLALACIRCPKGAVDQNLERHRAELRRAAEAGANAVLFPEMSLTGYLTPAVGYRSALTLDDEPVRWLVAATRQLGVTAVFGITERLAPEGFGIAQVVASEGEILAVQRKRHLGEGEEMFTAADPGACVVDLHGTAVGLAICAEAHHVAPFADAAEGGATAVLVSSAPGLRGRRTDEAGWRDGFDWWRSSALADLRPKAIAHNLSIAIASQSGMTEDEDFPGWGALIRPDGSVAAELPDWREATLVVEL
jgi:predicted amidohydrolase